MSLQPLYHVIFLGHRDARQTAISDALHARALDLGLDAGALGFLSAGDVLARDAAIPAIAIYLGHESALEDSRDRWIVFDNRGLLDAWLKHLDWLNVHLPVRAVWISNAPEQLKGLV